MIKRFSGSLVVVTLIATVMLTPPHIFATSLSYSGWAAEWAGNSGQQSNNFTPVQETTGPDPPSPLNIGVHICRMTTY